MIDIAWVDELTSKLRNGLKEKVIFEEIPESPSKECKLALGWYTVVHELAELLHFKLAKKSPLTTEKASFETVEAVLNEAISFLAIVGKNEE